MIEAVLFDFGGVFTRSPFDAGDGAHAKRRVEVIFGPYDRDTDHPWHRLERGEVSMVDARRDLIALGEREGVNADPFDYFRSLGDSPLEGVRDAFVERARTYRQSGLRTALVTNNVAEFRDRWRKLVPVDELFEVVVDSSEVGMRKPDPRIFRHTLEALGNVSAEGCVFVDDYPGNIRAAEALGMRGVLVGLEPSGAVAELDALLPR